MTAEGVPERCELCEAVIPPGRERCPDCGRVYGESNRCKACGAIAAVREVEPGRYVCAACSAPRQKGPRTPVDSDFAAELSRKATRDRVLSYVFFPVGGALAAVGASILAMGQAWLEGGWETALSVVGGGLLLVGSAGLFLASRWWGAAKRRAARAADAKLVLEVGRAGAGLTVEDAARAAQLPRSDTDARLTALAKQGQLELDVDDAGTIRYRVAELPGVADDAALAAETEAELQRQREGS
jgi:hypothetical protein